MIDTDYSRKLHDENGNKIDRPDVPNSFQAKICNWYQNSFLKSI